MAQGQGLYGHLTVSENLQVRAMLFGLPDVARAASVSLLRFGLARYGGTRVDQLSGGWSRRAGFAAALVHAPGLLLLDEPTVGLDAVARQDVWRHVLQLASGGVTVVVSTHDLAEAERNLEMMALFLTELSRKVAPGRHAALLVDQAGWHMSAKLVVADNITIVPLPPKCPELNP